MLKYILLCSLLVGASPAPAATSSTRLKPIHMDVSSMEEGRKCDRKDYDAAVEVQRIDSENGKAVSTYTSEECFCHSGCYLYVGRGATRIVRTEGSVKSEVHHYTYGFLFTSPETNKYLAEVKSTHQWRWETESEDETKPVYPTLSSTAAGVQFGDWVSLTYETDVGKTTTIKARIKNK